MKHIKQDFSLKALSNPLGGLEGWGCGQNSTFSEYGHFAYQIKGNDTCSNMVANILLDLRPKGQNIFLFLKVVMLYIKLKGMERRAP